VASFVVSPCSGFVVYFSCMIELVKKVIFIILLIAIRTKFLFDKVSVLMTEKNSSGHFMNYFLYDTFTFTLMFPVIILHFGIFSNGYQAFLTS
jgi:hypothetical protein